MSAPADERDFGRNMSFWEHLAELRRRLVFSLIAVVLCAGAAYFYRRELYDILLFPLQQAAPGTVLHSFAPTESFVVYLRVIFFAGLVAAAPLVAWQAWAFIAPGLKPRERRLAVPSILAVALLFIAGVCFVYFLLLRTSLMFLLGFAHPDVVPLLGQNQYFSFITALCVAGGVLFELPVLMVVLALLGLVNARWLWEHMAHAMVVLMVLAAVLTPTGDAYTMLLLTLPLAALYLAGWCWSGCLAPALQRIPPKPGYKVVRLFKQLGLPKLPA